MARGAVAGSVASPAKARQFGPSFSCAIRTFFRSRPTTTIQAPARRQACAPDKPNPVVPPIMTMTLRFRRRMAEELLQAEFLEPRVDFFEVKIQRAKLL